MEIRERALKSIISKLERGYTFDNDVARSRELLSKLFDWFLLEPCTCEDLVLQLIKSTLQVSNKPFVNQTNLVCCFLLVGKWETPSKTLWKRYNKI